MLNSKHTYLHYVILILELFYLNGQGNLLTKKRKQVINNLLIWLELQHLLTLQQICWFEVKNYHKHDFELEI